MGKGGELRRVHHQGIHHDDVLELVEHARHTANEGLCVVHGVC